MIRRPPRSTLFPLHDALPILPRGGSSSRDGALRVAEEDIRGQRQHRGHRSEEHTSELQSQSNLVCRLLLEKKKRKFAHTLRIAPHCYHVTNNRQVYQSPSTSA